MSLFWSQWMGQFYNAETVRQLKCSWNTNVVRVAMGVGSGGYLSNQAQEQGRAEAVIQAAIDQSIYVIVDWHDHNAQDYPDKAVEFFTAISKKYGSNANIIYEIFNEPLQGVSWTNTLKPYHEKVIAAIRANDKNNLIICGTPTWSQEVNQATDNPITAYSNIAYTLHYYAASHGQDLRDKLQYAYNKNVAIFVTEYGTTTADGNGYVDEGASNTWWNFLDGLGISYLNWSLCDKDEKSAALVLGTQGNSQVGDDSKLTQSGRLVKNRMKSQNNGVSCSGGGSSPTATTQTPSSGGSSASKVTVQVVATNSWSGGGQYNLVFKNNDTKAICYVRFRMSGTISSKWNMDSTANANEYTLASWIRIEAGGQSDNGGLVVSGGAPSVTVLETRYC